MAKKAKKSKKKTRHFKKRWLLLSLLAVILLVFGGMYLNARTVNIRYARVVIPDLPAAFHGTKILHVTDIDMMGTNTLSSQRRLFRKLKGLQADLVLLGGDYTAVSWLQHLNGIQTGSADESRSQLFRYIAELEPPLGCYAISGDLDGDAEVLRQQLTDQGIAFIDGQFARVEKDGSVLYLAGLDKDMQCLNGVEREISGGDCVIGLIHSPERFSEAFVREAKDGGQWMDLVLAGHTHGGQLLIGDRSMLTLNEFEKRYRAGWYTDIVPFLVDQGVGCEGINLRLGSRAEVWLIELRCK